MWKRSDCLGVGHPFAVVMHVIDAAGLGAVGEQLESCAFAQE